jgi:predicted DNA binding CopG/RHH family protein
MKAEYDLSKMKSRRNPFAQRLKRQITMRVGVNVIAYFKALAKETGIPYQNLMDFYLQECVETKKRPSLQWVSK